MSDGPEPPARLCVLCRLRLADDVEVRGAETLVVRELPCCWPCERDDLDLLVALVDDLHESQTRAQGPSDTDCPVCLSPVCDCHRPGRALGAPDPDDEPVRFNLPRGGAA